MLSRGDMCRERAKECRIKASGARSAKARDDYLKMADQWEAAAKDADYLETFGKGPPRKE